ncbi:MAG: lytic transglycosylase domain-containing protein [Methylococcales bacterium]
MDFMILAYECAPWVAVQTIAAIIKTESEFNPLAIGVNGDIKLSRQPNSKEEAVSTAKWLIANGYNIDLGLGQINSANLSKTGLTVDEIFDPCINITTTATILKDNYQAASREITNQQAALYAALSAYNTGSFTRGISNGYVQKIINNVSGTTEPFQIVPELIKPNTTQLTIIKSKKVSANNPDKPAVKLTTEKIETVTEPSPQNIENVYEQKTNNIMVY